MNMKKKLLSISEANEASKYKENYFYYKNSQKDHKNPYVILDKELYKYFPFLSNGSVKLYMLYVFQAKNETGESWHSVQSQADLLNVSKRSIDNWNNELIKLDLIARISNNKSSTSTFVLPVSDFSIRNNNGSMIIVDNKQDNKIDGELKYIFFLYQWYSIGSEEKKEMKIYSETSYIYQKEVNYHDKSIRKRKIINQATTGTVNLSISSNEVINDIYIIKNIDFIEGEYKEYFSQKKDVEKFGFVISNKFNLFDKKTNLDIVSELSELVATNKEQLNNLPEAFFIK